MFIRHLRRDPAGLEHRLQEQRVVPVWVGSQLSAYPLVVRKRSRSAAHYYDEWD
ncbi:MAG: hypothetical protein ACO3DQ_00880 [Cephaloticoccus sp.]